MIKKVTWINYDEDTDIRQEGNQTFGKVQAIIGNPIMGWGNKTHTVMALIPNRTKDYDERKQYPFDVYSALAHAKLTEEEVKSLPHFPTLRQYYNAFG
jgi:hypothetical protein